MTDKSKIPHTPAEEAMEAAAEITGSIFQGMMKMQEAMRHAADPLMSQVDTESDTQADDDDDDDAFDNMPV